MSDQLKTRRLFLVAGTAVALSATLKGAAMAAGAGDAEIITLSAEVIRLSGIANEIQETRIEPFEDAFQAHIREIFSDKSVSADERMERSIVFEAQTGRDVALEAIEAVDKQTDAVFFRMMAIPCTAQAGRAAKVRALLVHVMRGDWRGPDSELDWDKSMARVLLGEFAGMSEKELADV